MTMFGDYLKKIGKSKNARLWYCKEEDSAEHVKQAVRKICEEVNLEN